jgi:hypothetical protein
MDNEISKQINEIKNKYKNLKDDSFNTYLKVCHEEEKELSSVIDFKGKFICIDECKFLYVNEMFEHKSLSNNKPIIVLRGQGFKYLITPYEDSTYMEWDQFFSHEITIDNIEREINKIKEITEEEYNKMFLKMLEDIKKEHFSYKK